MVQKIEHGEARQRSEKLEKGQKWSRFFNGFFLLHRLIIHLLEWGVKKEDQKRIFERFYQVDAARTRMEDKTSHGLGLAIAKNLAERQRYKIVLRSSEGRGAEFEVVV